MKLPIPPISPLETPCIILSQFPPFPYTKHPESLFSSDSYFAIFHQTSARLQTKSLEKSSDFRKLYISFSKYLHFNARTILFHASNTCVWHLKQYSFTTQTILFHPRKSNVWRMKRKNPRFHSPEGVSCQQIGSYHHVHPISLQLVIQKPLPLHEHPNNTPSPESASICILRIARECPRNPPNRIFVRARPL